MKSTFLISANYSFNVIDDLFRQSLFTFQYACAISWQSKININCEASLFQRERKQHTMPDTCCAVGCQNRRNKNNPEVRFYRFPSDKTKETKERRKKWIATVKREK